MSGARSTSAREMVSGIKALVAIVVVFVVAVGAFAVLLVPLLWTRGASVRSDGDAVIEHQRLHRGVVAPDPDATSADQTQQ